MIQNTEHNGCYYCPTRVLSLFFNKNSTRFVRKNRIKATTLDIAIKSNKIYVSLSSLFLHANLECADLTSTELTVY
jgi:hypothetical protein